MADKLLAQAKQICVDWGSSNFRAFLLNANGELVDSLYSGKGMLALKPDEFEPILFDLLKHWPQVPIILAGMVGSLNGWRNVKYLTCPVGLQDLSANLTDIKNSQNRQIRIIAGIDTKTSDAQYDVARGEETQLIGAMQLIGEALANQAVFCLPGTHSKWMKTSGEEIVSFSTHMTGELFDILMKHSILSPRQVIDDQVMNDNAQNDGAFIKGIECAKADGGLAHHIFSARTHMINGELDENEIASYLSGILIGTEIKEMQRLNTDMQHVYLVGNQRLNEIYKLALAQFGLDATLISGEKAAYTGMHSLANNQ